MAKTPHDELLTAVADDFHTYLRRGVRCERVIDSAHPDLDIDDIQTLLRIHFVLTEASDDDTDSVGVVDFVRTLETRIRRMKTTTSRETTERRGEVRGHIDWQQTTKARSRSGRLDEPIFVSNQPQEHYDIDENLVLKRLLSVIYDIIHTDLEHALANPDRYGWLDVWTDTNAETLESTAEMFDRVFERNIYLQRIDEASDITDRTIEAVKRSRSQFYQQAAILLDRYRQLVRQDLDSDVARDILNHTLIAPDETDVLFELYWLFQILGAYDGVQYRVLTDSRDNPNLIASWESNGKRYEMYHDATGQHVSFNESLDTDSVEPDGYLYRMNEVLNKWQTLSARLLDRGSQNSLWGGRPDILLEQSTQDSDGEWNLKQVFIGEVKYTQDTDYAAAGLRELLEYMALAKHSGRDDDYVEAPEEVLESVAVSGLLFVADLDIDVTSPDKITVLQYPQSPKQVL
jgi:hypothetical protein